MPASFSRLGDRRARHPWRRGLLAPTCLPAPPLPLRRLGRGSGVGGSWSPVILGPLSLLLYASRPAGVGRVEPWVSGGGGGEGGGAGAAAAEAACSTAGRHRGLYPGRPGRVTEEGVGGVSGPGERGADGGGGDGGGGRCRGGGGVGPSGTGGGRGVRDPGGVARAGPRRAPALVERRRRTPRRGAAPCCAGGTAGGGGSPSAARLPAPGGAGGRRLTERPGGGSGGDEGELRAVTAGAPRPTPSKFGVVHWAG